MRAVRPAASRLARPLRNYLDWRFDRIEGLVGASSAGEALARVDVTRHNTGRPAPTFARLVSQVVSAGQFAEEPFARWRAIFDSDTGRMHRKTWEHSYVLAAAEQHGVLVPGNRALGFGVGREPIPAALAREGIHVVATDLAPDAETTAGWAATGQHMSGPAALSKPHIVDDAELDRLVETRFVDMTAIPPEIGRFQLVWSCGSLEHLGSPEAGLEFVRSSLAHLEPGGIAVHTTELELVPHETTRDHGHLAVYRPDDLDGLVAEIRNEGLEIESDWTVCLDRPEDRIVSLPPYASDERVHLKIVVGDSVLTSVGLIARRPVGVDA
jgi:SAM-dependent methyltransferase